MFALINLSFCINKTIKYDKIKYFNTKTLDIEKNIGSALMVLYKAASQDIIIFHHVF